MEHIQLETKYWETNEVAIRSLKLDIDFATYEIEVEEYEEAIAVIHVGDHHGRYIPLQLHLLLGVIDFEEDYEYEIGSEEEMWATDELIEEVNEELQKVVEFYEILPAGYGISFQWYDSGICTIVYPIS